MTSVLLVDDDEKIRAATKSVLNAGPFEVVGEAADGAQAVEMFSDLSPDVVVLDIDMPTRSGMEALRDIMKSDNSACVIMFTSVNINSVIDDCLLLGAADYVRKDLPPAALVTQISQIYAKHSGA